MFDCRAFIEFCDKKKSGLEGTRTVNLQIRSQTSYPLVHAAIHAKKEALYCLIAFAGNQKEELP